MTTASKGPRYVEIRRHPRHPETHWQAIVTTARGYCYACTWAGEPPTEETVRRAWREVRKAFDPHYTVPRNFMRGR